MRNVAKLFIALLLLWVTAVVIIPCINRLPYLADVEEVVRKWDINTSAFFYTDDISTKKEIRKYTDK